MSCNNTSLIDSAFESNHQQLSMNSSFRDGGDFQAIGQWFKRHPYPHCKAVNNLASLRSGVAIAQILAQKLPKAYHPMFLSKVQIYNLTPQRSMLNLRVMLNTLKTFFSHFPEDDGPNLDDFTPQGLYFDHNMMETFIWGVIIPLKTPQNERIAEELVREHQQVNESMVDIANLSSIIGSHEMRSDAIEKECIKIEERDGVLSQLGVQQLRIQRICEWLEQQHRIVVDQCEPEQVMGELVNSVFAGGRLDKQKIIKCSHYELGSAAVFKKIGDYLLGCERMAKKNVLAMIEEVQVGCVREELFWNLIEDIMNIRLSHARKMRKNDSKKIVRVNTERSLIPSSKQNINKALMARQASNRKQAQSFEYGNEIIHEAELWIGNQLGYEHSLGKSKIKGKREENPLLNGVLLGSIVMRMQLGKVSINKQPKNNSQILKNMNQVTSCIIRRGIEAGRKFSQAKPTYSNFIGIMWDVKTELLNKNSLEKARRSVMAKQKKQVVKVVTESERKQILNWLKTRGAEWRSFNQIPVDLVSQICGEMLQLRLLRQTTKRICQINMDKIVTQLRRLGWQGQGGVSEAISESGDSMRWSMLKFSFELFRHKVYYCR